MVLSDKSAVPTAAAPASGSGGRSRTGSAVNPCRDFFFGRNFAGGFHNAVNSDRRGGHNASGHHFLEVGHFLHGDVPAFGGGDFLDQIFRFRALGAAGAEYFDFPDTSPV